MKGWKKYLSGAAFFAATTALASTSVLAQNVESTRGLTDPGRFEDRFERRDFEPRVEPRIDVEELAPQQVPDGAEDITLTLQGIEIEGASVYAPGELAGVYNSKIGTEVSLAEVYGIASDITRKYRNDGYILTQVVIPPQTIDDGVVTMRVIEGYVNDIVISSEGENDLTLGTVRGYTKGIAGGQALNVKDLERTLLLINDLPGMNARSVLSPSETQAGAADLRIILDRDLYEGIVSVDNYGTRYLGPWQAGAAVSFNSLLSWGERLTFQAAVAPDYGFDTELAYGSVTYWQPINGKGTAIELSGSHTSTEPGYNISQFDVKGWSNNYRAKIEHPFIRTRSMNLEGYSAFDWRDVRTKNNIPVDPNREDNVRALRVGATAELLDSLIGLGYNTLNLEFSKGLNIFGANDDGDTTMSRPAADPSFEKVTAEYQRLQRLLSDVNLLLGVRGQFAEDNLVASEEIGIGGSDYGRGYDPSEAIGNSGYIAKAELQWTNPLPESPFLNHQFYTFYDAGTVWDDDSTTNASKKVSLASTGVGMRFDLTEGFSGGFYAAIPLNQIPQTRSDKDARYYMNISQRF